jgi:epoxyqueuosine reductase
MISHSTLTEKLRETVLAAGIDLVGVTSAEPLTVQGKNSFAHTQPREVMPDARAVIVAGFCVRYEPNLRPSEPGTPRGRFTPYGSRAFVQMWRHCENTIEGFLRSHGFRVAGAPRIPVKPAAVRAGLGRYGKHAVVVTPELGSWVMFACFVTDAPLAVTEAPLDRPASCPPRCNLCAQACPTGAITAPFEVDRPRCITEWLWGYFAPTELRTRQENRLFGCGECLLACPKNRRIRPRRDYPVPIDELNDSPELIPFLTADEEYFRRMIPTFALEAGIDAIRGNVIIALGNIGDPAAVDSLGQTLRHKKAQIRAYSAWALGRIGDAQAYALLGKALVEEKEPGVLDEIKSALAGDHGPN